MKKTKKIKIIIVSAIIAVLLLGGAYWQFYGSQSATSTASTSHVDDTINLDNGDEDIDWDSLPTTNVTLTNETYAITGAGTYIFSGSTTAGITVNTDGNVRIALNNATIKSTTGAAIYVESAENAVIQLADGTTNTVEDSATRTDETIDGAIYSADDLILEGNGTLSITSNFADAIVSKDDLKIASGTYTITSVDDGIRGKDSVNISGGTITVIAGKDGIKATNDADTEKGFVYISGDTVTVSAGDDGIKGEQKVTIDGGNVTVKSSVEGLEAAILTINNGTVSVTASDDGINGSASTLITNPVITINGGTVDVTVGSGDTDAIDSNGDVYINGGIITITAPTSSIDFDGTGELNGGTVTVNGTVITEMPENQMGGGMNRR